VNESVAAGSIGGTTFSGDRHTHAAQAIGVAPFITLRDVSITFRSCSNHSIESAHRVSTISLMVDTWKRLLGKGKKSFACQTDGGQLILEIALKPPERITDKFSRWICRYIGYFDEFVLKIPSEIAQRSRTITFDDDVRVTIHVDTQVMKEPIVPVIGATLTEGKDSNMQSGVLSDPIKAHADRVDNNPEQQITFERAEWNKTMLFLRQFETSKRRPYIDSNVATRAFQHLLASGYELEGKLESQLKDFVNRFTLPAEQPRGMALWGPPG
jgi:hypothetical protein